MKANKSIETLRKEFNSLSITRMKSLTGGDDLLEGLFSQIFNMSATNLSQATKNVFVKQVSDLSLTQVGRQMLQSIYDAQDVIYVTGDQPFGGVAAAQYDQSTNTLSLGKLDSNTSDEYYNEGLNYAIITHELFHAYTDNYTFANNSNTVAWQKYNTDIRSEIDATFFAYMASAQYDIMKNLSYNDDNSHLRNSISLVKQNATSQSEIEVKNAWEDIFYNGNFTNENYNKLIKNFETGTSYNASTGKSYKEVQTIADYFSDSFFVNTNGGFLLDTKLTHELINDTLSRPSDIMSVNPDIRKVPLPPEFSGSGGTNSGSSGGGGGGAPSGYDPFDPIWHNPYDPGYGTNPSNPSNPGSLPPTWFDSDGNYHPEWGHLPHYNPAPY